MGKYEEGIVPIKISHLAEYVSKVKRISPDEALMYIFLNPMYDRLYDERAKWWYLSTDALYDEFERWRNRQRRVVSKPAFEFYAYCIEAFAREEKISGIRTWALFKEAGVDDFLIDNYDLLHTQGTEYVLDDIRRILNRKSR